MNDQPEGIATDVGLVSVAVIWGVNFAVMKVVLVEIDPLALNALRFPLAAVALAIVLGRFPGPALPDPSDRMRVLSLGLVGNVAYQLCFIFGLDWTLAGNASLLLATTPTWTLVLSIAVRHEQASRSAILGVVVTLGGVALVVLGRGDTLAVGRDTLAGDALMLVAAVLWAFYTVAGRGPALRYGSLRMTSWTLWVGTPVLVALGAPSLAAMNLSEVSAGAWAGVVYAGLLSIGVAYVLWYRGVRRLGNSRTAVYSNLVPVTALFVAWLWLGEVPTPLQLVGAAVILAGLTLARVAQSPGSSLPRPSIPAARSDEVI